MQKSRGAFAEDSINIKWTTPDWLASGEWSNCNWRGWLNVWCCKPRGHDENHIWSQSSVVLTRRFYDEISKWADRQSFVSTTALWWQVVVQLVTIIENHLWCVRSRCRSKREAIELLVIAIWIMTSADSTLLWFYMSDNNKLVETSLIVACNRECINTRRQHSVL